MSFTLIIGGIPIPRHAGIESQSYEPISGSTLLRMANGAGKKRTHWNKLKTTISGNGWLPLGLGSLDFTEPLELACIQPRGMSSPTSQVFALPTNRRRDVEPWGFGLVGGRWYSLPVDLQGDTATLGRIEGGELYHVNWLPLLTVYMQDPASQLDPTLGEYSWTIEAEEA